MLRCQKAFETWPCTVTTEIIDDDASDSKGSNDIGEEDDSANHVLCLLS